MMPSGVYTGISIFENVMFCYKKIIIDKKYDQNRLEGLSFKCNKCIGRIYFEHTVCSYYTLKRKTNREICDKLRTEKDLLQRAT